MTARLFRSRATALLLAAAFAAAVLPVGLKPVDARAAGCSAWMDTTKTPDQRAQALLAAMTQADKLALTQDQGLIWSHYGVAGYIASPDTNLCIPDLVLNDAGQGVGDQMTGTTAFPSPISQSASWDPAAQQVFGAALGAQAHAKGVNVQLTPGIETDRVPLNGRNWEYMSEDPYLASQVATAVTKGIQSQHVIATLKHYLDNSQENIRNGGSSDLSERVQHEIYLPQYEAAIQQGNAGAIMCAYNRINGIYACQNPDVLATDLRQQIGFPGFVMSDWGAQHSTVDSAKAGLDMEMGSSTYYGTTLGTAITGGQVSQAQLDTMVLRILRSMFAVGLFDHPIAMGSAAQSQAAATPTDTPDQNTLAGQIAEQGTVLLKNQGAILPLQSPAKRIAVIGTVASAGAYLAYNGGGSGHIPEFGYKPNVISPLTGMQTLGTPAGDVITYANGNGAAFSDAVAAATAADVAVVFVYDSKSEGVDQSTLALPPDGTSCSLFGCTAGAGYNQDALVQAVAAANPNTVVVLMTGGPVLMPWVNQVKGVVEAWYPGQDEGDAIASVLFGTTNPAGHLPETFPIAQADLPTAGSPAQYPGVTAPNGDGAPSAHDAYSEGLNVGYRWYDDMGKQVLFPFGYGLSYTTFSYKNYQLTSAPSPGGNATVSFDVTNTGHVAGQEVAQVYVGSPASNYVNEPLHQLRAYQKTGVLQPNATQHITLSVGPHAVSYWDETSHAWKPETGCHPVWVGGNSRDIRLQGSGLNGSMSVVANCPASVSTYTIGNTPNIPEVGWTPGLLITPAVIVFGGTLYRRRRRPRANKV